ncbi:MAG: tail fiber domain-containing protein [Burkholderiales bacterium]
MGCISSGWAVQTESLPSPLLAIDRNRATVVDRVVAQWGDELARSNAGITQAQLREMLLAMRADQLLAATLAGSLDGLRNVVSASLLPEAEVKPSLLQAKALGDANQDITYVPVTPCRLVETRGTFAAVYQGGGAFAPNQIRTYTLQGGNGVCLSQLPASVTPSAVQMQVYGIPTTTGSGDIEILPQGSAFGSSASLVYLGSNAFTSSAVTTPANIANKQISVQVRGGGAHLAIDVVGYFRPPQGGFVTSVTAGTGLTGGTITSSGTIAVDTTAIQSRVTGTCAAGSSIRTINANGTVTCQTDANSGGTVTSVATGAGLAGGPITTSGTISLSATQLLPACSSGQLPQWNGSAWTCASAAGTGTVTSVASGTGLSGGPITTAGTLALAASYQLPQSCTNGQIPKSNGAGGWTCAADANSGGTVTSVASGTGLTGGPVTATGTLALAASYQLPQSCTNGQVAKSNGAGGWTCANDISSSGTVTSVTAGAGLTGGTITTAGTIALDPTSTALTGTFYKQGGNAFGGTAVIGTTDNNAIDIRTNGARVMRYEPIAISPNLIGGSPANNVTAGVRGATVTGGGAQAGSDPGFAGGGNVVTDAYGTVGGGLGNVAGDNGGATTDRAFATVGGGGSNTASGYASTVGGGYGNTASGYASTVGGGYGNNAIGYESAVAGGTSNLASGSYSAAVGGVLNVAQGTFSFAAGNRASALHDGAFVWSDGMGVNFGSTSVNEFSARATGGARFVTAIDAAGNPTRTVKINPNGALEFGSDPRQMINLYGPSAYGIGVQDLTHYSRTAASSNFAWYSGGVHANGAYDPGAGGVVLATLQSGGGSTPVTGTFRAQAFTPTSDRAAKTDFVHANTAEVLDKVVSLPIATWAYRNERDSGVRHIGPTAQDFHDRFAVGYDDKTIATVDADGVALAAIQGLNAKLEAAIAERDARIDAQARAIAQLRATHAAEMADMKRAVEVLLARTSPEGRVATGSPRPGM